MTRTELRTLFGTKVQDTIGTSSHWTTTEVNDYLDRGYADFQDRTLMLRKQGTVTLATATTTYSWPVDLIRAFRTRDHNGKPILIRNSNYMDTVVGPTWRERTGNRILVVIPDDLGHDKFRVFPIPTAELDTKTITVDYAYRPAALIDSESPAFRQEYHIAVLWFALAEAFEKELDRQHIAKAGMYREQYERMVRKAKVETNRGFASGHGEHIAMPAFA